MTLPGTPQWISAPSGPLPMSLGAQRLALEPPPQYPSAMVNVTNHCNLHCEHCFVFRDGNPNSPEGDMPEDRMLRELERLRDRHGIRRVLWMGGEPMLRWRMLERALPLFEDNTITTNGTVPLKDFGPDLTYVVSLDGPKHLNDAVRGAGVFERVMRTVDAIPDGFRPSVVAQCVVHRENQESLEEFVRSLRPSKIDGIVFSFYVPRCGESSSRAWASVEEREQTIDLVFELKRRYSGFIWNSSRSLELMRPATSKLVTDHCILLETALPLYVEAGQFTTPFCCYGNDVDCDRCGAWGVFASAAKVPGPWDLATPVQGRGRQEGQDGPDGRPSDAGSDAIPQARSPERDAR
jgi:organic radical activating enzyme